MRRVTAQFEDGVRPVGKSSKVRDELTEHQPNKDPGARGLTLIAANID